MDTRNPFSRLKKKVKRLGNKLKPGRAGADTDGESAGSGNPLPQPELHVVANDGEGNGADEGGQQAGPTDQPRQLDEPELSLANEGENDQGVGEAYIDGGGVDPMYSHPHLDIEIEVGSKPCRGQHGDDKEGDGQIYPHSLHPSVPHGGEPDGVLTPQFKFLR